MKKQHAVGRCETLATNKQAFKHAKLMLSALGNKLTFKVARLAWPLGCARVRAEAFLRQVIKGRRLRRI